MLSSCSTYLDPKQNLKNEKLGQSSSTNPGKKTLLGFPCHPK